MLFMFTGFYAQELGCVYTPIDIQLMHVLLMQVRSCVDVHNIMYIAAIMVCIYVCSLLEGRANRSSEAE